MVMGADVREGRSSPPPLPQVPVWSQGHRVHCAVKQLQRWMDVNAGSDPRCADSGGSPGHPAWGWLRRPREVPGEAVLPSSCISSRSVQCPLQARTRWHPCTCFPTREALPREIAAFSLWRIGAG